MGLNTLERRLHNQCASFIPWVAMIYSLLVVDKKMIFCCLDDYKTAPLSIRNA